MEGFTFNEGDEVCFWREHNKTVTVEIVVFVRPSGDFATIKKQGASSARIFSTRVLAKNLYPLSQMEELASLAEKNNAANQTQRSVRPAPAPLSPLAELRNMAKKAVYGDVLIQQYHYRVEAELADAFIQFGAIPFPLLHYSYFGASPSFLACVDHLEERPLPVKFIGWAAQRTYMLAIRRDVPDAQKSIVVSYKDYYNTAWWHTMRAFMIELYGGNCAFCGATENLNVHHKTYKNIGAELPEDLSVLCEKCHSAHHKIKRGGDVYDLAVQLIDTLERLKKAV